PNDFVLNNVWVDNSGLLHLQITNASGAWTCAELYTNNRFTFGTFQWQVEGRLDLLDRKIVLGLFTYGPPVAGVDGTNEIDIEFSRWGQNGSVAPNLYYTVWPATINDSTNATWMFYNQTSLYTTHRIMWSSVSVAMKSLHEFQNDDTNLFHSWQSWPGYASAKPQATAPIHMNLWVFHYGTTDRSPSNGNPIEIIIHDFTYVDPTVSSTITGVASVMLFETVTILIGLFFVILSELLV
ncbi:unnamed protein product, partial [Rotaria sp. Silwood2]